MARGSNLEQAKAAICANCPRTFKGRPVQCGGNTGPACPLQLWPVLQVRKSSPRKSRGRCCGG